MSWLFNIVLESGLKGGPGFDLPFWNLLPTCLFASEGVFLVRRVGCLTIRVVESYLQ